MNTDRGWIDAHLDLGWLGVAGRRLDLEADGRETAVSWPDLATGGIRGVFGTIFTEMDGPTDDPASYPRGDAAAARSAALRQLEWYRRQQDDGVIRLIRAGEEILPARGPLAVALLMECADPILDPEDVSWWIDAGVSVIGLSWARGSRYSGGNATPEGLTKTGRELVRAIEDHGAGFDLSHLSRAAFDDLLEATEGPVCATHSNSASLAGDDPRHLTDDQLRAVAARDGVIGLNLYGRFLIDARGSRPATIETALDHVEHAAGIVGRDRVGLGSDADGGFTARELPDGLRRLRDVEHLARGLAERGWAPDEIEGFRSGNWRRWWRRLGSEDAPSLPEDERR